MACKAQGQGTIKVVELTTPSVSERRMPALHAWDLPKSSALMINKRASSGYPNKRLVWLLCDWGTFLVSFWWDGGRKPKPRFSHARMSLPPVYHRFVDMNNSSGQKAKIEGKNEQLFCRLTHFPAGTVEICVMGQNWRRYASASQSRTGLVSWHYPVCLAFLHLGCRHRSGKDRLSRPSSNVRQKWTTGPYHRHFDANHR